MVAANLTTLYRTLITASHILHYNETDVQDLLVRNIPLGAALADVLAGTTTQDNVTNPAHSTVLLSNHGFTTCSQSIELAVMQAMYVQTNAVIQASALALRNAYLGSQGSALAYLSPKEASDSWATMAGTVDRPWNMSMHEVQSSNLYVNRLDPNQTAAAAPDYVL
ncbi:hypothetical protein AAFC00_000748 [Neodothiora populina]|uniref:Class II aldolase/adducin N-terminal domain-containing protein n=1 Tax=Neodothiora populina TaxID=2781224 RepID=A0ABR3PDW0_9PEZI